MKLLSYNIHHSSQDKLEKIMAKEADIYILPELANPSQLQIPHDYQSYWMGDCDWKGLGIVVKSTLSSKLPEWFKPKHKYLLPLYLGDILIIATWPTKTDSNKDMSYPQILLEALEDYVPYLKQQPTIISGDFNCFKGQQEATKRYSIETILGFLEDMGFVSIYHQKTHETLGRETMATYYHQFKENYPFFLDYTFANIPVHSYKLCRWNKDESDHVAQEIII